MCLTLTIQDLSKEHTPFCRSCQLALGEGHVDTVHHGQWPMARNWSQKEHHGLEEQNLALLRPTGFRMESQDIKIGNIGKGPRILELLLNLIARFLTLHLETLHFALDHWCTGVRQPLTL